MKSARLWALSALAVASNEDYDAEAMEQRIERMFKEHARDQRERCANAVAEYHDSVLGHADHAALNAPAPGES